MLVQRLSNQFFTRTRLTVNQYCNIRIRQPANSTENLLHCRRFANNFTLGRQGDSGRSFLLFSKADTPSCHINQFFQIKGLRQVFKGATLIGCYRTIKIGMRCCNDNRQILMLSMNALQQFQSVHSRHTNIRDYNLWL